MLLSPRSTGDTAPSRWGRRELTGGDDLCEVPGTLDTRRLTASLSFLPLPTSAHAWNPPAPGFPANPAGPRCTDDVGPDLSPIPRQNRSQVAAQPTTQQTSWPLTGPGQGHPETCQRLLESHTRVPRCSPAQGLFLAQRSHSLWGLPGESVLPLALFLWFPNLQSPSGFPPHQALLPECPSSPPALLLGKSASSPAPSKERASRCAASRHPAPFPPNTDRRRVTVAGHLMTGTSQDSEYHQLCFISERAV